MTTDVRFQSRIGVPPVPKDFKIRYASVFRS